MYTNPVSIHFFTATGLSNPGYSDDTDGAIPTVASGTSTFKGRKTKAQRKAAAEVVSMEAEVVAAEAVTPPAAQSTPKDVAPPIEDKKAIMSKTTFCMKFTME